MNLTEEQQNAVDTAIEHLTAKDKPLFKIGGYAGTGKTTIAKWIVNKVPGAMVCAFTGKAASRLREKGLDGAATIHSTIYDYDPATESFDLKHAVGGSWFLIDEGSMIATDIWHDIQSFGKPIVLLGDPGQLEPIGKDPDLMGEPDVILEQIHRQAEGSGILRFAEDVRLGLYNNREQEKNWYYDDVTIRYGVKPTKDDILWADVVICGYNRTRHRINKWYRGIQEWDGWLNEGERIICLRNNRELCVFNGQMFEIVVPPSPGSNKVVVADNGSSRELKLTNAAFGKKLPENLRDLQHRVIADYGYAITCHKSQGSEWDKVVIIDQQCSRAWDAKRWRYTAITRAAKELRYFFC